jgi:nucleotide-binding universal stress UspA family protein
MMALRRIRVATDFSPASDAAFLYGRELARHLHASLVLHVWDDITTRFAGFDSYTVELASLRKEAEAAARDGLGRLLTEQDRTSIDGTTRLLVSHHAATTIVEHARENFDLIIVGSHGRTGVDGIGHAIDCLQCSASRGRAISAMAADGTGSDGGR